MSGSGRVPLETYVIAIFLSTLDIATVTPTLPAITADFHLPIHWSVWVISLHLAIISFSLPLMESWALYFGRNKWFTISLIFFSIGSVVAALSMNWVWLMLGRAIQAIGASGIVPYVSMLTRRVLIKGQKKDRRYVIIALIAVLIFSPAVTSFIIYPLGWRTLFFINLPLSILLFKLSKIWGTIDHPGKPRPMYGEGIFFFGILIFLWMTAVTHTDLLGWRSWVNPDVLPIWILSFGLIVPFFMVERRGTQPFFEPHLFANWKLWLLYMLVAMTGFSWMAIVIVPGWDLAMFQLPYNWSGAIISLILFFAASVVPLVQKFAMEWNFKWITALGFLFAAISYTLVATKHNGIILLLTLILLGVGLGLTLTAPVHLLLFQLAPTRQIRNGLMALGMFRVAGGALGLVTIARLFASLDPDAESWFLFHPSDTLIKIALKNVMFLAAGVSILGFVLTLLLPLKSTKDRK